MWCSQACRRAAYEERRAAAAGAIGVQVAHRTTVREHPLSACVDRTIASPVGCRRVLQELTRLALDGTLDADQRWESARSALNGLMTASRLSSSRRW